MYHILSSLYNLSIIYLSILLPTVGIFPRRKFSATHIATSPVSATSSPITRQSNEETLQSYFQENQRVYQACIQSDRGKYILGEQLFFPNMAAWTPSTNSVYFVHDYKMVRDTQPCTVGFLYIPGPQHCASSIPEVKGNPQEDCWNLAAGSILPLHPPSNQTPSLQLTACPMKWIYHFKEDIFYPIPTSNLPISTNTNIFRNNYISFDQSK